MDSNDYFGFNPLQGEFLNTSSSLNQENFQQSQNIKGFNNQLSSSAANFQIMSSNQFNPFSNESQTTKINIPSIQKNQNFDINNYENEQINVIPNYQQINNQIRESIEVNQDTFSYINPGTFETFFPENQNKGEIQIHQNRHPTDMETQYDEILQYINTQYPQNTSNIVDFERNHINKNVEQGLIPLIKYENTQFNDYSFKEPLKREVEPELSINQNSSKNHNEDEIPPLDDLPLASDVLESGVNLKNIEPIPSLDKMSQFSEYRTTPKINEIKTDYLSKMSPISVIPEIPPISAIPEFSHISAIPEISPISVIPEISHISAIPEIPPISVTSETSPISENQINQMTPISQVPRVEVITPSPLPPVNRVIKSPEKIIVKIPKIQKVIVPKIQKVIVPSKSKIFITKTNTVSTTQEPVPIINPDPIQVHLPFDSSITYQGTGTNSLMSEVNIPSTTTSTLNIPVTSNITTTLPVPNSIPFQTQTMLQTHIPVASTTLNPGISMPISTQLSPTLSQTQIPMVKTIVPIQTHIPYNKYNIKTKSIDYTSPQFIPRQIPITQISPSLQQANTFSQITQNPLSPIYQQGIPRTQVPTIPQYQYSLRTFTPLRKDNLINQNIGFNRSREYNASTYRPLLSRSPSLDKIRGKRNVFSPSRYINRTYRPRKL